jgi:hypothetical protein
LVRALIRRARVAAEYEEYRRQHSGPKYCIADHVGECDTVPAVDAQMVATVGTDQLSAMSEAPCDTNGNDVDDFLEVFRPNTTGGGAEYTVICESPRLVIIPIVTYTSVPIHEVTIRGWSLGYLVDECVGSGQL